MFPKSARLIAVSPAAKRKAVATLKKTLARKRRDQNTVKNAGKTTVFNISELPDTRPPQVMYHQSTAIQIHYFSLGPFHVQCTPNAYEHYTRYTILANGILIRDQISYPEIEDGWQGIAFSKSNRILTEEQLVALKEFGHPTRLLQRRLK